MLHIEDSLVRLTDSSFLNNAALQEGGVMSWNSSIMYNDTLIVGNRFFNNTAIAGGILFQASFDSTRKDVKIDSYWSDMADSQDMYNAAGYGPLIAGVITTLKCAVTEMFVSGCANFSSHDAEESGNLEESGNFYSNEQLFISESQVTCCLLDIFDQPVTDRNKNGFVLK